MASGHAFFIKLYSGNIVFIKNHKCVNLDNI